MLPTIRHSLRFGRELARERAVAQFLPWTAHVDEHTLRTRDGYWLQVLALEGLAFETMDAADLGDRREIRNTLLRSIASSRVALAHHVIRRRVEVDWAAVRRGDGGRDARVEAVAARA